MFHPGAADGKDEGIPVIVNGAPTSAPRRPWPGWIGACPYGAVVGEKRIDHCKRDTDAAQPAAVVIAVRRIFLFVMKKWSAPDVSLSTIFGIVKNVKRET